MDSATCGAASAPSALENPAVYHGVVQPTDPIHAAIVAAGARWLIEPDPAELRRSLLAIIMQLDT